MLDKKYLLFLAIITLVSCSNVIQLTDKNFNQTVSNNKYVMVKFYAPWCGHCKSMIPEYQKLADLLKDNGVVIGQLDATVENQTAENFKIQGFPTIKFFVDGFWVDYKGARTSEAMYQWIKKVSETVLQQITSQKVQQLKLKQNFVVYYGKDSQKIKVIEAVNILDNGNDYFISTSSDEKLVLYLLGKQPIEYPSTLEFAQSQIRNWVLMSTLPVFVPLSSKQYLDWVFYDQSTTKDVLMLLKQSDVTDQTFKNLQALCQKKRQTFKCCYVDQKMQVYQGVKGYLKGKGSSVLAITKQQLKQLFIYKGSINQVTEQSWDTFLGQVAERKHQNMAAAEQDKVEYQHVKVLTDANFTSFIQQNKVVFVEFYSPGCTHCVQFAPQYDAFAKKVYEDKANGQFIAEIAAVDLKNNQKVQEQTKVTSFPSFRVYLQGSEVDYQGPRTQADIVGFIKSVKTNRPILAGSIAEVPSPSVVIYGDIESSQLKFLPSVFTRYPIYQIKQGDKLKVILRGQQQKTFQGQYKLKDVSKWLHKQTDPVLVNLLNPNLDNKLVEALQNKVSLLALIDIDEQSSQAATNSLQEYCKLSTLVCGYAKKGEANFKQFTTWAGISSQQGSKLLFINTENFDKYIFTSKLSQMNADNLSQFVTDVKQGKIKKIGSQEEQKKTQQATKTSQQVKTQQTKQAQKQSEQSKKQEQSKQSKQSQQSKQGQQSKQTDQEQSESQKEKENQQL